jgi:hypothetical protein
MKGELSHGGGESSHGQFAGHGTEYWIRLGVQFTGDSVSDVTQFTFWLR